MEINTTYHGFDRILERTHCKRANISDHLQKVWSSGKLIEDYHVKSSMARYLTNVCKSSGNDRSVRVKGNLLYLFNKEGNVFITCYEIPQKVIQNKNKCKV